MDRLDEDGNVIEPLVPAAEDPQEDQEQVDEAEVDAPAQQERIVVARPRRLDPSEVVQGDADKHHAREQAERQAADGQVDAQRREAHQDADQEDA